MIKQGTLHFITFIFILKMTTLTASSKNLRAIIKTQSMCLFFNLINWNFSKLFISKKCFTCYQYFIFHKQYENYKITNFFLKRKFNDTNTEEQKKHNTIEDLFFSLQQSNKYTIIPLVWLNIFRIIQTTTQHVTRF